MKRTQKKTRNRRVPGARSLWQRDRPFIGVTSCSRKKSSGVATPDPYLLFGHSVLTAYLDPPLSFHCSDSQEILRKQNQNGDFLALADDKDPPLVLQDPPLDTIYPELLHNARWVGPQLQHI
ncbi:unnamed protein product [Arctogadus glacialis]